jgi:hypothetical protein
MKRSLWLPVLCVLLATSCAADEDLPDDEPEAPAEALDSQTSALDAATIQALLSKTASCNVASNGKYKKDSEVGATVNICSLHGAFFWKADMDIDCDGKRTSVCNENTDPWYQDDTSAHDSHDRPLDASKLPYVVIPLPSSRFKYQQRGIELGQVVAVIYNGKLKFGVFGDEGPSDMIGEASNAMAKALGIPSNPENGGVDSGVTYIVFTGHDGVVDKLEDTAQAASIGAARVTRLLQQN